MWIVARGAGQALGKPIGGLLLGGVILWQVALHAGPTRGRAIIHVPTGLVQASTDPVDLRIDATSHRVATLDQSPVICELEPGRHGVGLLRRGEVLREQEFEIGAGEDVTIVVGDRAPRQAGPPDPLPVIPARRRP